MIFSNILHEFPILGRFHQLRPLQRLRPQHREGRGHGRGPGHVQGAELRLLRHRRGVLHGTPWRLGMDLRDDDLKDKGWKHGRYMKIYDDV